MAIKIEPEVMPNDRVADDIEIDHIVCCEDVHTTFCGKHVDDPYPITEIITSLDLSGMLCVECAVGYRNPMFCPKKPCCTNEGRR